MTDARRREGRWIITSNSARIRVCDMKQERPEPVKLLILVSDGQPADTGYYGTAAEEDLRGVKHEYQRKGVCFIAAAIGSDKENN